MPGNALQTTQNNAKLIEMYGNVGGNTLKLW